MNKIKINSKDIIKGDTFIAIKGNNLDGHDYIEDAIKNGASKIICEKGNYSVETINVIDTKKYLEEYLYDNYKYIFNDIKIIGITGTNGKTTTSYLTSNILKNLNVKSAYIGTIGFYINGKFIKSLANTTPDTLTLYKLIYEAYLSNVKYIVMEVSSHSLEMNRLANIKLDVALFTNLTRDHLDYHKTMDNYLNSKLKIIDKLKENGTMIINNDSDYCKYFKKNNYVTYGFNDSNYKIINYEFNDYTKIKLYFDKIYDIEIPLKSKFNIYNYISALSILNVLGFNINEIISVSKKIECPPGRMETYKYNENYIIIDYAHTPDAVDKIINAVRESFNKEITTIIGCGGNRDKEKRPIMGKIACKESNFVIFTNDNPRNENPNDIINDITSDLKLKNYDIILDRKKAIIHGLNRLNSGILLILGKGHENYQIIDNNKFHFSDKEIVIDYIKNN